MNLQNSAKQYFCHDQTILRQLMYGAIKRKLKNA